MHTAYAPLLQPKRNLRSRGSACYEARYPARSPALALDSQRYVRPQSRSRISTFSRPILHGPRNWKRQVFSRASLALTVARGT